MASVQRIKAAEKSADALRLKSEGHSYREIADKLGYKSPDGAYKAVKRGLDKLLVEPAEAYVKMQLIQLEDMSRSLDWKIKAGDVPAILAKIRLLERQAKLLGLYAPAKIDIEHRIRALAEESGWDPEDAVIEAQRLVSGNHR